MLQTNNFVVKNSVFVPVRIYAVHIRSVFWWFLVNIEYLTMKTPFSNKNIIGPSVTSFRHNKLFLNYILQSFVAICSNT